MRAIEFIANNPGDWAFHCHKSHHTMNAMGHQVPTLLGVKQDDLVEKIGNLVPDYMPMGETGMAEMTDMKSMMNMPLPENTIPMTTGTGQYGAIDMGGMFTTVKIRDGLARNDYKDPGAFKHPKGTVAREVINDLPPVERAKVVVLDGGAEMSVRKPMGNMKH